MEKSKQQQKQLEEKDAKKAKDEQVAYDAGMTKTAQLKDVAQFFCAEVWSEALNTTGIEANFDLRGADKVYYPLALHLAPKTAPPPPNLTFTSSVPKPITTPASTTFAKKEKEQQPPSLVVEFELEEVMEVQQLRRKKNEKEKEATT